MSFRSYVISSMYPNHRQHRSLRLVVGLCLASHHSRSRVKVMGWGVGLWVKDQSHPSHPDRIFVWNPENLVQEVEVVVVVVVVVVVSVDVVVVVVIVVAVAVAVVIVDVDVVIVVDVDVVIVVDVDVDAVIVDVDEVVIEAEAEAEEVLLLKVVEFKRELERK